jgi:rod shape-determining protein MreC
VAFRDGPFENLKVPLAWTAAAAVLVALIVGVILLIGDRRQVDGGEAYAGARGAARSVTAPVGGVLSAPVRWTGAVFDHIGGYFFAVSENRRLKAQIVELQAWRDDAIALKSVNARYEAMLGVRTDPPIPMATGRVVSDARGPYSQARLINLGSGAGVRIGNPVVDEHGLVGRIVGVSGGASRMLLLTDVSSKTPVMIERTDARALLSGDGSGNPRLEFVRGQDAVQAGDRILTSGDGGALPRGLPVGVVARGADGRWRVKLFSDRGPIDFVRVLLFQDFVQLADQAALNAPPLAGLATAPPPDAAQAAAIADVEARRRAAAEAAAERQRIAQAAQAQAQSQAQQPPLPRATTPPSAAPVQTPPVNQTRPAATSPRPAAPPAAEPQTSTPQPVEDEEG